MARIPLPSTREDPGEAQRVVWDAVVSGQRGCPVGPLRASIHNAELARNWSALGECLRFGTGPGKRLCGPAVVVTGRRGSSQVEWFVDGRRRLQASRIPEERRAAAKGGLGVRGAVAPGALVDYYSTVAMILNAHNIPLPEDDLLPLSAPLQALFELPSAELPEERARQRDTHQGREDT